METATYTTSPYLFIVLHPNKPPEITLPYTLMPNTPYTVLYVITPQKGWTFQSKISRGRVYIVPRNMDISLVQIRNLAVP